MYFIAIFATVEIKPTYVNTLAHTQSHSHISNDKITHTRTLTLNNKVRYVLEKNYRQKKNRLKNYRLIYYISEFAIL